MELAANAAAPPPPYAAQEKYRPGFSGFPNDPVSGLWRKEMFATIDRPCGLVSVRFCALSGEVRRLVRQRTDDEHKWIGSLEERKQKNGRQRNWCTETSK